MAQKKFKYPLVIEGNWKSLLPELEALGYKNEVTGNTNILVTNAEGINGRLMGFLVIDKTHPRTTVNAADRELVLALAAALEGEETQKGEAYVCKYNGHSDNAFTTGKVYLARHDQFEQMGMFVNDRGSADGWSSSNHEHFRKATKEEIIDHFKPISHVTVSTKEEFFAALGIDSPNITSEEPVDTHISVRKAFIKDLYDYADDEAREALEKELPSLFPRPTFRVGETIVLFKDGTHKLMIIGSDGPEDGSNEIALLDLSTGRVKSDPVVVEDTTNITEAELLEAGEECDLTRCNYAKFAG